MSPQPELTYRRGTRAAPTAAGRAGSLRLGGCVIGRRSPSTGSRTVAGGRRP